MKKYRVIFAGTPQPAVLILQSLLNNKKIDLISVLTQKDKPAGRNLSKTAESPVKTFAQEHNLVVKTPESLKSDNSLQEIKKSSPDVIIIANYSQIIPQEVIDLPQQGIICFHPSLLPKYRGSTPIQTALLNRGKQTGISFFLIDKEVDHGPIIYQETCSIQPQDLNDSLTDKLYKLGAARINQVLNDYLSGSLKPKPQNHEKATFTQKLTRENGEINPTEEDQKEIWTKYRAYYPWPGIWLKWEGKRIKITKADYQKHKIVIEKIQLEGKKEVTLKEFKNGHPTFDPLFKF